MEQNLIKCVVIGNKPFRCITEVGGVRTRVRAQPGDIVHVTAAQMRAFPHRLTTPNVARAQQRAVNALEKAQRELEEAQDERSRPTDNINNIIDDVDDDDDDNDDNDNDNDSDKGNEEDNKSDSTPKSIGGIIRTN